MLVIKRVTLLLSALALLVLVALALYGQTGSSNTLTLGTTPGNPASGKIRLWANTASGFLECLTSSGASCIGGIGMPMTGSEVAAPGTPASSTFSCWPDSTDHTGLECKTNNSATIYRMVATPLANTKGGTGGDSSAQTGFAKVTAGTWSYAALAATDIPAIALPTPGTSITLASPGGIAVCTGTCTITIPVPTAGVVYCVVDDVAITSAITINNPGSSTQFGKADGSAYGTATTGTAVSTAGTNSKICLFGRDTTHYVVESATGTWTMN